MSATTALNQFQLDLPEAELPPTQDDLPYEDGVPMETERHRLQMDLLIRTLKPWLEQRGDGYVGGNMFVYYSLHQVRNEDFKGPDVFVALDVSPKERKSWVIWDEGKGPDVIIELLSDSTAAFDKNLKKQVYQDRVRAPEYYWFDPFKPEDWAGFVLDAGRYEPIVPYENNRLLSPRLGLALTRWRGVYLGVEATWLRWMTVDGKLLLSAEELAIAKHQEAEQRVEQEHQRAERLLAQLKELGVKPDL